MPDDKPKPPAKPPTAPKPDNGQGSVVAERKALTQDLEQISLTVVDHAFWRAAQLLAAVLVLLAIGLVAVLIFLKRSPAKTS